VDQVLGIKAFDLTRTLEMDPEFLNTDGEHEHDASVTSVGIVSGGPVDLDRLNAWLGPLVEQRGADIYRMKGVLAIDGRDEKYTRAAACDWLSTPAEECTQVPRGAHDIYGGLR